MIKYLTLTEIKFLHKMQIDEFSGSHGIRDEFLLHSALLRPQTGYYTNIIEQTAALWESLSQNHAFIDGNKRIALEASLVFLDINGYGLKITDEELTKLLVALYHKDMTFEALKKLISNYIVKY
ncbi:Fic/DOC family protein [Candidatus Hepatincola sp. Pdp]